MSVMGGGVAALLEAMGRLGASVASGVEERIERFRVALRAEVRRAAAALAFAIAAAAFVVGAMVFAAVAVMMAAWNTHPVMAAALIAMGFALLAIVALLLLRDSTH